MQEQSEILFEEDLAKAIETAVKGCGAPEGQIFVLTDEGSEKHCAPLTEGIEALSGAKKLTVGAGDDNKNINAAIDIWNFLGNGGGTRHSLLINLGGGMVTDLGGFAANTFKRGIKFINIPTTLLSMVDAAVGGKTGINFNGLKNEIGVINPARYVIICPAFLATLDRENLMSGYAEMIKHGLLTSREDLAELLSFDPSAPGATATMGPLIKKSIAVKERIVEQDPNEKGLRKALNLGHTIGHALESRSHARHTPVLHGYAVAWGLVMELYLSYKKAGFPQDLLTAVTGYIKTHYGAFQLLCKEYDELYGLMLHDKKNATAGEVNFTLLSAPGECKINCTASKEEILEAIDYYRDFFGI